MAPKAGDIQPTDAINTIMAALLPDTIPSGTTLSMPVCIVEALAADANVHSIQNPFDSDCLVTAIVSVTTADVGEDLNVGVDSDGTTIDDTIFDVLDVGAATGVFHSTESPGTAGGAALLNKKGGANDFLVFAATAGTDTLVGTIVFMLIPINS